MNSDPLNLVKYCQSGNYDQLIQLINENTDSADFIDDENCSLLHWAAINNRVKIANLLIANNASVNYAGGLLSEIPLQWACRNDKFNSMMDLLLRHGSSINNKNVYGHTALHICIRSGNIHNAFILLSNGAEVDAIDNKGNTPLHCLLKDKHQFITIEVHRQVVQLLLNFGASVLTLDENGNTALHILAEFNDSTFDPFIALLIMDNCGYSSDLRTSNALMANNKAGLKPDEIANHLRNLDMIKFLYDAYMYRVYPRGLPVLAMTVACLSSLIIIDFIGLMYGLPIAVVVFFIMSRLFQDCIVTAKSRVSLGWAVGVIVSILWSYHKYVSIELSLVSNMFVSVLTALIAITLYLSTNTKAVHLQPSINRDILYSRIIQSTGLKEGLESDVTTASDIIYCVESSDDLMNDGFKNSIQVPAKLCTACICDKSLAHHCSRCNMCVVEHDHHCEFVSNCVGRGNRRVFLWFTFFAALGTFYVFIVSLYHHGTEAAFLIATCLSGLVSVWIFSICMGQLFMIGMETTTFEILRNRNDGRCIWNKKIFQNIFHFLWTGHYYVTAQTRRQSPLELSGKLDKHTLDNNNRSSSVILLPSSTDKESSDCDDVDDDTNNSHSKKSVWTWLFGKRGVINNNSRQQVKSNEQLRGQKNHSIFANTVFNSNSTVTRRNLDHHNNNSNNNTIQI